MKGTVVVAGEPLKLEDKAPAAVTTACAGDGDLKRIGSIVVVPSDAVEDEVGLKVVAGIDVSTDACKAPEYAGCIVARRTIRFVPHTELVLPVVLRGTCEGVPCDATTTCVLGQCVPTVVERPELCTDPTSCGEVDLSPCDDTQTNAAHCGACDRACSTSGAESVACIAGSCVATCSAGRLDCSHPAPPAADDGCERSALDDTQCGACGNDCTVDARVCRLEANLYRCACAEQTDCGGGAQCLDEKCKCFMGQMPLNHCTYGEICDGNAMCTCNGGPNCNDSFMTPDGLELEVCCPGFGCADLRTSVENCGACGRACPPGSTCVNSACSP